MLMERERAIEVLGSSFCVLKLRRHFGSIFVPHAPIAIDARLPVASLLEFRWERPDGSWSIALGALPVCRAGVILGLRDAEEGFRGIAAAIDRGSHEIFREFLVGLMARNGADYGIPLFAGLPSHTLNRRPDLLPARVVKEAYGAWLEWADGLALPRWNGPGRAVRSRLFDLYFTASYGEQSGVA